MLYRHVRQALRLGFADTTLLLFGLSISSCASTCLERQDVSKVRDQDLRLSRDEPRGRRFKGRRKLVGLLGGRPIIVGVNFKVPGFDARFHGTSVHAVDRRC